jgi:copper homeostasis protein
MVFNVSAVTQRLLESAVETIAAARAAERAGAGRLELCAQLDIGGVSPGMEAVKAVIAAVSIPVFVMVRPRGGDFIYSDAELEQCAREIVAARAVRADGVVLGVLTDHSTIDVERTRTLVRHAGRLPVTFHRAFDATPDPEAALEDLIEAGASRVLTSGGAPTAAEGIEVLRRLAAQARGRIVVIAAGHVRPHNVGDLLARTSVTEVHARFEDERTTRTLVDLL